MHLDSLPFLKRKRLPPLYEKREEQNSELTKALRESCLAPVCEGRKGGAQVTLPGERGTSCHLMRQTITKANVNAAPCSALTWWQLIFLSLCCSASRLWFRSMKNILSLKVPKVGCYAGNKI